MPDRCDARNGADRCELDADHDGAHMSGLSEGANLIHAWPRNHQWLIC